MGPRLSLEVRSQLDSQWLNLKASELHQVLQRPTVFDLQQPNQRPIFVSTLLHGNETTGWDAVRQFLKVQSHASIVLLIGNVEAARCQVRHLDDEEDFNRIWRQKPWQSELEDILADTNPWCAIDIHNNSSPNPHYSVVTDKRPQTLNLAKLFSNQLIYTEHTLDIISYAASKQCPSITIETGTVEDPKSVSRTYNYLLKLASLCGLPSTPSRHLECYETLGTLQVVPSNQYDMNQYPHFNTSFVGRSFEQIHEGTLVASELQDGWRLVVNGPGEIGDKTDKYLKAVDDSIYLKQNVIMSMFTENPTLAMQDCVCYFLEHSDFST